MSRPVKRPLAIERIYSLAIRAPKRGVTRKELAARTGYPHQTVSRAVNTLIAFGFAEETGTRRDRARVVRVG
jgi:DNA-binding IclR family transcriptional regulator